MFGRRGEPEPKTFHDERLGELRTVVRDDRPGKWCSREALVLLEGQAKPTTLRLSGDSTQPYRSLLAEVHRVLDHRASLARAAALEIARVALPDPVEALYVSDIHDWDEHDNILQLELSPVAAKTRANDMTFEWSCGGPEHIVVARASAPQLHPATAPGNRATTPR